MDVDKNKNLGEWKIQYKTKIPDFHDLSDVTEP